MFTVLIIFCFHKKQYFSVGSYHTTFSGANVAPIYEISNTRNMVSSDTSVISIKVTQSVPWLAMGWTTGTLPQCAQ